MFSARKHGDGSSACVSIDDEGEERRRKRKREKERESFIRNDNAKLQVRVVGPRAIKGNVI